MSIDELQSVFQVSDHSIVPEYEVIHLRSVSKRSTQDMDDNENIIDTSDKEDKDSTRFLHLSAFGRDVHLTLQKSKGLLKKDGLRVWTAEPNSTQPDRVEYVELPQEQDDIGEVFQDETNMAALIFHKDKTDGGLLVEGTIGHDLVVKPVPPSFRHHLISDAKDDHDDEMFLDSSGEDITGNVAVKSGFPLGRNKRSTDKHKHIVFKRNVQESEEGLLSDYIFMEPDYLGKKFRRKRSVKKREAPYVIYPEILVIVDYDGYRLHGGDNVQIKRYFVSFWNGVDLRYKLLKGPKIRISIAGIIISRGRDATPYLERNRVGRDAIDSAAALTDMGKYLFRERRLPVYDIAVAITKLDMCRRQYANDVCNRGTAGFAYVGGACVVNKRLEKVNSVAIIEDTGGFSGIIVGAHEVGHLLGAVHDGSPPPSYLGGPGAEKCRWEDGYIMSDLRHTEKGFRWSPCSVSSFHHFLNGDTATCLYNSPHEDESLPRVLPGKLLTLDAQCRRDRGTSACFKDDRVCAQLFCFDSGSGYCVAYRPAAEGSPCGDGQYCINGRCVAEHENIIPDYSQNTPTYIRRNDANVAAAQTRSVYVDPSNVTKSSWDVLWSEYSSTTTQASITTTESLGTSTSRYKYYSFNKSHTQLPYHVSTSVPFLKYTFGPKFSLSTTRSPYDFSGNKFMSSEIVEQYDKSYIGDEKFENKSLPSDENIVILSNVTPKNNNSEFLLHNYHSIMTPKVLPEIHVPSLHVSASQNEPVFTKSLSKQSSELNVKVNKFCEDRVANLSGSMTCYEFLSRYGYQYCSYRYIHINCCRSWTTLCSSHVNFKE